MSIRWGLCCLFVASPIRFRQATHRYVSSLPRDSARAYLSDIARSNAIALAHAIERCHELGIGAFRVSSQIAPLSTHPTSGYELGDLPDGEFVTRSFRAAGELARLRDVRLSFHPDQFVVLGSDRPEVARSSREEMDHQGRMAELIGADTLCLHAGGAVGGKGAALDRLRRAIDTLSDDARTRLALENDDRCYTVADLIPVCRAAGVPLIYDVHHHRANPDGLSVSDATDACIESWGGREAWMHISSPRDGWSAKDSRPHADYIDPADVPEEWWGRRVTVDVEAKAKELAVVALLESQRDARPHEARAAVTP